MLETERILRNQSKLAELHPVFCSKLVTAIQEMEQAGFRPRIQEAWRSPDNQLAAFHAGTSKLKYGFHNITAPDGTKEALAADILDDDHPEDVGQAYILHLAAASLRNGLISGAFFDLTADKIASLYKALVDMNWNAPVTIGWDPLHVQVTGMTVEEAKAGKRPLEQLAVAGAGTPAAPGIPSTPGGSTSTPQTVSMKRHYRLTNLDTNQSVDYEWSAAFKPVMLLAVPYIWQTGPGAGAQRIDCGAACAVMLLGAYLNLNLTPDEFHTRCGVAGNATMSVAQVRNGLGSLGLLTDLRTGMSLQDVFNTLATGKPLITLLRYKTLNTAGLTERPFEGPHFAVAVGIDCKNIYLHDPLYTDPAAGEAHAYPLDLFWQAWKDAGSDPTMPTPERAAIIPAAGIGFRLTRRAMITAQSLNVRAAPNANSQIVASLHLNDIVEIQREMNGWGEIGEKRWISLSYTAQVSG